MRGAASTAAGRGPAARDAVLWAVMAGIGVLAHREEAHPSPVFGLVLPLLVLAVAVPAGRTRPGAAVFLANAVVASGLADPTTTASPYLTALAVLAYLLGLRVDRTGPALVLFGACTAIDLALCAALDVGAVYWFYAMSFIPAALLLPWLAGRYRQARLALVHEGWQRARHLEQRQRSVAEQARLRERTRIASDMHDSLGHELSLIALRAGALELSPTLTGRDRADLAVLRAAVSDAVGHLRDTVGVLRDGSEGVEPTASSVEPVEELVARTRESGVTVHLRREGPARALPPLVDRSAYRVVQESLTNAIKHAPGSTVHVSIARQADRTEVRVTNSAPRAGSPSAGPGAAVGRDPGLRGLTGLRERVLLIGGTLRAAPREGGYEVLATLPDQVNPERAGSAEELSEPGEPREQAGSESARRLAVARRGARYRFVAAFAAPVGFGLVTLVSCAYLAQQLTTCVLRPADFAAVRVGQDAAEVARFLPEQQFRYVPDALRALPLPPGTVCAYYRSNGNLLDQVDVYRLCYAGSRLAAKDVLPG
ncbi:sensor histidine kinase [Streptomyces sp. NBC_01207]|uniref:sensor histidine kinase n=1 Tax=Streptomyces sp. NBC_01207 TaxID=2903772 RepID=UPI002E0FB152|nr:histidine kinase [Streptomyces sp. NBC_01207]